ncbi:hypothetical protein [Streptomyces cyanogenus]|uniref:hypothetical protein n=1 Tax=Streptomyces cyanogenus TaxID=80860 RepID=UPI001FB7F821|nr:hypothetical protein [Streptomyces cyanogenus]
MTAQSGKIVSAIAEGGGTSSLTVSLTWTEPATAAGGADPGAPGGGLVWWVRPARRTRRRTRPAHRQRARRTHPRGPQRPRVRPYWDFEAYLG